MLETPRILAFAGSLRVESYNKRLARLAAAAAREAGAEVTWLDLRDLPLPLFNQDDEDAHGLPENAKKFKALLQSHHGVLLSCPEYNSSMPGCFKNAIDWASRAENDDEPPLVAFSGKTWGIMSASPGALGGLRSLVHVRAMLGNIGVLVLPGQLSIPKAGDAFDEHGALKDLRKQEQVAGIAHKLVETLRKLG